MSEKCKSAKCFIVCGAHWLGALFAILAAVFKLHHLSVASVGPKSLAASAALLFLFSIASSLCCCGGGCACKDDCKCGCKDGEKDEKQPEAKQS